MIASKTMSQIEAGASFAISRTITETDIDRFAELTGDISPLHMSHDFASGRGFQGRIVHGALLIGYFSQIIGVHFPGENALLVTVDAKFTAPVLAGETIDFLVTAEHISEAAGLMRAKGIARSQRTGEVVTRCVLQIAFTNQRPPDR